MPTIERRIPGLPIPVDPHPERPPPRAVRPPKRPGRLFVDPHSAAADQAEKFEAAGDHEGARLMRAYAAQPKAVWLTGSTDGDDVRELVDVQGVRVLVLYNIPDRDLGSHSAGGVEDAAAYRKWAAEVAAGIVGLKKHPIVIVEPDAIAMADRMSSEGEAARYAMLAEAAMVLTAAGARVFLDAGDSHWIPAADMAERLIKAGIEHAKGLSTNVAHHETDSDEHAWAAELRTLVHAQTGKRPRYVVDTGRNGRGPYRTQPGDTEKAWCNSPGVAVGARPTLNPVDASGEPIPGCTALLWVKGLSSDGPCRGGPKAGAWWPERARELCARAVPPL